MTGKGKWYAFHQETETLMTWPSASRKGVGKASADQYEKKLHLDIDKNDYAKILAPEAKAAGYADGAESNSTFCLTHSSVRRRAMTISRTCEGKPRRESS
jgi:hypothetical protein